MKKRQIFLLSGKVVVLLFGIFAIVAAFIAKKTNYFDHILLGLILMVSTLFELFENLFLPRKNIINYARIVLESVTLLLAMAYFFLVLWKLDIDILLALWGSLEIASAVLELLHLSLLLKFRNTSFYILVICAIIRFIFGVILIITLEEGLFLHLIIVGALLSVSAILEVIKTFKESK